MLYLSLGDEISNKNDSLEENQILESKQRHVLKYYIERNVRSNHKHV